MKKIKSCIALPSIIFIIIIFTACASSTAQKNHNSAGHEHHSKGDSKNFLKKENAITRTSKSGLYKISLYTNQSPIPIGKIHDWTVHIEKPDGKPLENAKIFVFGGMPMHQHDFPTVPRVKEHLGNGDYRVEGIKFSMRGHWEMRFTVKENNKQDKVIFDINL